MKVFVYLCILLFIIAAIIYLIVLANKNCPNKIKRFYIITLSVFLIRYGALLLGTLLQKQIIIYVIRIFFNCNFICTPLLLLGVLYIFYRDENRTFDYNYSFMFILTIIYIAIVSLYKLKITIDNDFGFIVSFKKELTPILIYLVIMASITIISLIIMDKPHSNISGMILLTVVSMINVIEFVIFLGGIKIFPYPMVGEILNLFLVYKTINSFK